MGWTKQQLIEQAFGELALAGFVFDLGPEQMENALRRLDSMMAEWSSLGISIGYVLPPGPDDSNLDDDAGIADVDTRTVFMNLAVELAAGRGKSLTAQTIARATGSYNRLLGAAVKPQGQQSSTLPLAGAGNKPWRGW